MIRQEGPAVQHHQVSAGLVRFPIPALGYACVVAWFFLELILPFQVEAVDLVVPGLQLARTPTDEWRPSAMMYFNHARVLACIPLFVLGTWMATAWACRGSGLSRSWVVRVCRTAARAACVVIAAESIFWALGSDRRLLLGDAEWNGVAVLAALVASCWFLGMMLYTARLVGTARASAWLMMVWFAQVAWLLLGSTASHALVMASRGGSGWPPLGQIAVVDSLAATMLFVAFVHSCAMAYGVIGDRIVDPVP